MTYATGGVRTGQSVQVVSRKVTKAGKDKDGDITSLCGSWGSTSKVTAIAEIKAGTVSYYVQQPGTSATRVIVAGSWPREYLKTEPDGQVANNLDALPNC